MTITIPGEEEQLWLIDDADFDRLSLEDQQEYLRLLEAELNVWTLDPTPRGKLAHLLAGKVDWLLCGGAAGGGKSETLAFHAWELDKKIPGHHSLVLRTSLPELRRSFILRTIVRYAQTGDDKIAKLRSIDNVKAWWWENGSVQEFGYCSRDADVGQFLSAEYDLVCFDESTQFSPYMITMILGRLRTTRAKAARGARPHALLASNPGDIGHPWHYDLFIEPTEYGQWIVVLDISEGMHDADGNVDWDKCRIVDRIPCPTTIEEALAFELHTDPETQLSIGFVPFKATDNPMLDPSVRKGLNALPELERRQKRDGDWDTFVGKYFTTFERDIHVIEPFTVPASWDHAIGLDHGWSAPYAAVFGAWDEDGNCYIWEEDYEIKLTPREQAARVLAKLDRIDADGKKYRIKPRRRVADPAVFSTKGEGKASIGEQWRAAGLACSPAQNARVDGWMNVLEYLHRPILDDARRGPPKVFIFNTCRNLIREITNAMADPGDHEDVDTRGSDHALDAWRYLLATRPRKGDSRRKKKADVPSSRLEQIRQREIDRIRKSGEARARRLGLN